MALIPLILRSAAADGTITVPAKNILDNTIRQGLIPVSLLAIASVLSTFTLLSWLTYRLVVKHDYQAFEGYNQYVILIYNLLLADLQQSLSFVFSIHWLRLGRIDSPSNTCFAQGWLIHIGDVASGLFVLAIALHTWLSVVYGRKLAYKQFTWGILGIWAFALLLTVLGPAIHGPHFFVRAGAWCWADAKYDLERLWLHYVWIFIVEFGSVIIYAHVFLHLRNRLKSIRSVVHNSNGGDSTDKLSQAARYMVLYPIIYVILTLPLAAGRMAAMSGSKLPDVYYCIAGSLMTSCGWLDSLLYTLTRRVFIKPEPRSTATSLPQTSASIRSKHSKQSKRRWVALNSSHKMEPMPPPSSASNWHLSTFASMDRKIPNDSDDNSDDLILEATFNKGRSTPAGERNNGVSHTETFVAKGEEDVPVVENAILSETTIEVVSISREEAERAQTPV